jgi:hypothetical protein
MFFFFSISLSKLEISSSISESVVAIACCSGSDGFGINNVLNFSWDNVGIVLHPTMFHT